MPQQGWIDPANGREVTFEEALDTAERHGEALGFPYEVLLGMSRQLSGHDRPDGITVTQLLGCARAVSLESENEFYAAPQDGYAAYRGTIAHSMLESSPHPAAVVERRFYRHYQGETISGQLDKFMVLDSDGRPDVEMAEGWAQYVNALYAFEMFEDDAADGLVAIPPEEPFDPTTVTFVIEDWKSKSKVPFGIYVYEHHKEQGNLYRWLLRAPKDSTQIRFIYVSMDEVKGLNVYNGGTFANGRARPVQVWTDEEVETFLDDRMRILSLQRSRKRPLPYAKVPVADLWQCTYCPVRDLCYTKAGDEALEAFQKGESPGRLPPRDAKAEEKVKLPKKRKTTKKEAE